LIAYDFVPVFHSAYVRILHRSGDISRDVARLDISGNSPISHTPPVFNDMRHHFF